jgi:hypothetical protein
MYVGLEFYCFWKEVSLRSLEDYALRLKGALKSHYQTVGFSETEFVRTFRPLLNAYDPHGNIFYTFDLQNKECTETWKVRFRHTQISHFEAGVVRLLPSKCKPDPEVARSLLEYDVASFVSLSELAEKGISRLLGKPVRGSYRGYGASIYIWEKITKSRDLNRKLRWEAFAQTDFRFFDFAERIATLIQSEAPFKIELSIEGNEIRRFMQQCDDKLKNELTLPELVDLFSLINLSHLEWLT